MQHALLLRSRLPLLAFVFASYGVCSRPNTARAQNIERDSQPAAPTTSAQAMIAKAVAFLRAKQDPATGAWGLDGNQPKHPAITGLVLQGLLGGADTDPNDPAIAAGVKYLLDTQKPDGGIYDTLLPSYNTAICLSALSKVRSPPQAVEARARATQFLKSLQYGEGAVTREGAKETAGVVSKDDPYYGGWGYGNRGRPDLSNTSFAVEALRDAGVPENDPAFARAVAFMQRCQMLGNVELDGAEKPVNTMPYAQRSSQGGFVYSTSVNKDRVGVGQSFAGETLESLSGGPGSAVTFSLRQGTDGKPLAMTKQQVEVRLTEHVGAIPELNPGFLVLLGPTGDGLSGSNFVVRGAVQNEHALAAAVTRVFEKEADARSVRAWKVAQWNGESKLASYGSMTYSGFKSYLYAGLGRDDARVRAAAAWIADNYSVDENPGMGTDGLYYYYVVFAKAHRALGLGTILTHDAAGVEVPRVWAKDLREKLATLQNEDGSFRSVDDRWMEDNQVLITAYALVALRQIE